MASLPAKHLISLSVLLPLLWAGSLPAVSLLSVGQDARQQSWLQVRKSSRFMAVQSDSIWMWDVAPNANLARGIPERDGSIGYEKEAGFDSIEVEPLDQGDVIYDGDGDTAFDPDGFPELARTTPLILDLGGAFRIDRIRLFPRLDHQHQRRFLQAFSLGASAESREGPFALLFGFTSRQPNVEPLVDRRFASRDVRYIRLQAGTEQEWEIAEWEVYGDGSVPVGEYLSVPLEARRPEIVWGKVRYEGGLISGQPVVVQTRTGPDPEPLHFFRYRLLESEDLERVTEPEYRKLDESFQGPVRPNPAWSGWETVTGDLVRSPGLRSYLQFQVQFPVPGVKLKQLTFEYIYPPIAGDLAAEICPASVEPGVETEYTLSLEVHLDPIGSLMRKRDSGFLQLQVRTAAEIGAVKQVRVDDRAAFFRAEREPGQGFTVDLGQRIEQDGSFVQIVFLSTVFQERTRFEVAAVDHRETEEGEEQAYQVAREADVDPVTPGGSLTVRFAAKEAPLIGNLRSASPLFTPNGDGINEVLTLTYSLLKLIQPVVVRVDVRDLAGRRVRQVYEGMDAYGNYARTWDGRDEGGELVRPGLYLYEVRVKADTRTERRQGVVGVVY